jgi:hypothetical protein
MFSTISEGTFTGQSDIITVEGAARITVAISLSAAVPNDPSCKANWVVPSGKLADVTFEDGLSSIYLPINNNHSDVAGPMPVVLPKIRIACTGTGTTPVDYAVFVIK